MKGNDPSRKRDDESLTRPNESFSSLFSGVHGGGDDGGAAVTM